MRPGRRRTRLLVGAAVACSLAASVTTKAQEQPRHLEGNAAIGQDEVRARCIPTLFEPGQTCEVGTFAKVGAVAGHDFFYARYDVNDPSYPLTYPRIVIFEQTASAMFQPILISGDNPPFFYGKPEIVRSAGRVLLRITATKSGTGNFNREMLYVWAKNGWRDADVTSWLDDLRRLLPDGLRVLKGVYPDYATMKAETTLWREEDGPPCPTGGLAEISLQWRGDRLAVRDMHIAKAGECGEPLRVGRRPVTDLPRRRRQIALRNRLRVEGLLLAFQGSPQDSTEHDDKQQQQRNSEPRVILLEEPSRHDTKHEHAKEHDQEGDREYDRRHSAGRGGALAEDDALPLRRTEPLEEFRHERSIDRGVLQAVQLNEYPEALAIGELDIAPRERIFGAPVQLQFDRDYVVECPPARKRAGVPDESAAFHDDAATVPACARRGQSETGSDIARRGGIAILHALSRHPC